MARYTKSTTVKIPIQWYKELKESADSEGRPVGQMLRVILLDFDRYGKKIQIKPVMSQSNIECKRVNVHVDEYTMCEIDKIAKKTHRPRRDVILNIMEGYLNVGDNLLDYYI